MMRAIFLTHEQKAILDDCGLSTSAVLPENRSKYLTAKDARQININNYVLGKPTGSMARVGFPYSQSSNSETDYYVPEEEAKEIMDVANTCWLAECPTTECIVIWPDTSVPTEVSEVEEGDGSEPANPITFTANSMLRRNLRAIVKAMSKVMSFKEVAASRQFELSVLND